MASTSFFRASSSSSSNSSISAPKNYDVFLSFRGEDTRYNFTDHLYQALVKRGIRTFRDDNILRRGEAISLELLKAIEESRSSVIVFSERYAHSRWCLDELVKIMDCHKYLEHFVFPIFYHVDPSHIRNQTERFGEAFAAYEENRKDKVGRWRTALTEAGNLSGWHLQDGYESNYIKEITNCIFHRLTCQRFDIGANLVGIYSRLKELHLRLHMESNDVRIVGIYGIGGIGKTTIAKAIYNKLSCDFEYMSFLENISEVFNTKGLSHLQAQLLSDILREERSQNIKSDGHGASMIKAILLFKRVLIVLDDVDDQNQLEYLIGTREWLGKGSRVIITTRDKHLLTTAEVNDLYEVMGLNSGEAYKLFSLYAFKQNCPKLDFINLSCRAISYCKGLPLALKVLGSLLFSKTIIEWESELSKLEREPEAKIHKVLKRSYDGLDRTEKNILLDVACFFRGRNRDFVSRILDGCDFYATRGIKNLNDKCLITLPNNKICMHDLIQQMSWEIVRENFPNEPNKWSRLWDPHDIECALRAYEGMHGVETISLDLSKLKRVHFISNVFAKMTRLRLLKVRSSFLLEFDDEDLTDEDHDVVIENASKMKLGLDFEFPSYELRYLCWDGYPLEFLPSNFDGENLIELHLKCSNIKGLWQGKKILERLEVIDISYSKKLIQMPEFSGMSNLGKLILKGCESLMDIHPSIGVLKKLTILDLRWCDKLKGLPSSISKLEALVILNLSGCSSFEKFPEIQGNMRSLRYLYLDQTAITELPNAINLESVLVLDLCDCLKFEKFPEIGANMKSLKVLRLDNTAVKELPTDIANWEPLPILDLSKCSKFEKSPEKVGNMKSLKKLCLENTAIKDLPDCIGDLASLEILDLSNCSKFEKFPEMKRPMRHLHTLNLRRTAIEELPSSIYNLYALSILDLADCKNLRRLPENISRLRILKKLSLDGCSGLWEGSILYLLSKLGKLNINHHKMDAQILELPSSLEEIHAHGCRSKEDVWSLLWYCHLNWFRSATELDLWIYKPFSVIIPEKSGGIFPEWIRYDNLGSKVTTELPMNWHEDTDFLGFVVSCVYQPCHPIHITCELNIHGNGFGFKNTSWFSCLCKPHDNLNDQVWVRWCPKINIPKEHHHKFTRVTASFWKSSWENGKFFKKCGVNLIFVGDVDNHMPMLLNHLGNSGDNGSVIREESNGNHKRSRDDSLRHEVEEPQCKRLEAPNTNLSL